MIHDQLPNFLLYLGVSPRFAAAADFLATSDLAKLPVGRTLIDGDDVFANVSDYETHDDTPERYEDHRRYIDIQVVVSGKERVGMAPYSGELPVVKPYDEAGDIEFVRATGEMVPLQAGEFLVIFPHEAHQPAVHPATGPEPVRKIIVKVRV